MPLTRPRMTADEFLALPTALYRQQLIDGELIVDSPLLPHQVAVRNLLFAVTTWERAAPGRGVVLGGGDLRIDEHNVFQPDVWWVAEDRRPSRGQSSFEGAPDLIAEVRSPPTWRYDRGVKRHRYEAEGVAELWLVDTDGVVFVYRRSTPEAQGFDVELEFDERSTLKSPLLPDFALPVADIFEF